MKKILFIFVLSLYSIQGYASSCPDGSEPVRSISEDGTYFVFNCSEPVSTSELQVLVLANYFQTSLKKSKL
jgi:hypothetical protein